jgi:hypothetical protein
MVFRASGKNKMGPIKGLRRFCRNRRGFFREFKNFKENALFRDLRLFPEWFAILKMSKPPIEIGLPWISLPALQFLDKTLIRGMQVFEWGCGGSTLFYAKKGASVISVEHSLEWSKLVADRLLLGKYTDCSVHHVCPQAVEFPDETKDMCPSYLSTDSKFHGKTFLEYVCTIDAYPDKFFDLVAIDGRARSSCVVHAVSKVKPGGYLLWDNTERPEYQDAMRFVPGDWRRFDLVGPIVCGETFSCTTVWHAKT